MKFFQGTLRQITVNDLPVGRNVDEILRLVKAFQFVDKHGEGNKSTVFNIFLLIFKIIGIALKNSK